MAKQLTPGISIDSSARRRLSGLSSICFRPSGVSVMSRMYVSIACLLDRAASRPG